MIPIDIAVALEGPLLEVLLPLTIETMRTTNRLEDVHFHFVDKGIGPRVRSYIDHLRLGSSVTVHDVSISAPAHANELCGPSHEQRDVVMDVAKTCQWMVENCGSKEWIALMHFDLEFIGPWIDYYRGMIAPSVGQIGDHAGGMVLYQRKAVNLMEIKFWNMSTIYLVKNHYGVLKARHGSDPRCTNRDIHIDGFDVGELLELYLQHYGWGVIVETDVQQRGFRIHNGSGSGRCGKVVNDMIFSKTIASLREHNITPIQ